MAGTKTGTIVFSMTVDASKWQATVKRFHQQRSQIVAEWKRTHHYLDCQRWWMRSDVPPEYEADVNDPEWWQEGREPPGFCAA